MAGDTGNHAPADDGVVVVTDRLVVRAFRADDLPEVVALHADPEVMHHITNGVAEDPDEVAAWLDHWVEVAHRDLDTGCWAAVDRSSGRFVGWFHLFRDDPPATDTLELGYRLRRDAWGLGLAAEGSRALVDRAFATTDAARVRAETMVVHTASRRVMEKVGMHLVRVFDADWPVRIPGDEHGDVEYAIDRADGNTGPVT
ncbi:GNAT family N-acetyltransferase [Salsipaludibacter albus]|uniref:GNAT family N-acetyltransferase n=1 Tax=Salsipaludibacter albus TaxID=2849650 RepID=UPI001EE487B4|nr:GNAT family N-acetyltransferase [Salsipaludibacter albus]MBY5162032.1 GNAT family N-acetyltransferase [Salsipaludibacter albus]